MPKDESGPKSELGRLGAGSKSMNSWTVSTIRSARDTQALAWEVLSLALNASARNTEPSLYLADLIMRSKKAKAQSLEIKEKEIGIQNPEVALSMELSDCMRLLYEMTNAFLDQIKGEGATARELRRRMSKKATDARYGSRREQKAWFVDAYRDVRKEFSTENREACISMVYGPEDIPKQAEYWATLTDKKDDFVRPVRKQRKPI